MRSSAICGLALALGFGCATAADAATLRIGLLVDPDILDPTLLRTFASIEVLNAMCDKLIDLTPDQRFVPQLATEWSWSQGAKTLVLMLRRGVKFHDGEPVNAAAVKYSIDRHRSMPGSVHKAALAAIQSVEVVDDLTVKVNLSSPIPGPFLAQLVTSAGMIVSPKAAQAAGEKFGAHPVCAGPYRFVERVAQDHITIEKFADYWDKDRVHIDRIVYRTVPDSTVRLANLQSGDFDLIEFVEPSDLPRISGDQRLRVASAGSLGNYVRIFVNVGRGERANAPLGRDARVRQAFDLAIDREAITKVVFNGEWTPANSWIPPESPYALKSFPPQRRDVAKAKALLASAGQPNPNVELTVLNIPAFMQVGQMIQAMTKEAGFDVKLLSLETVSAIQAGEKGDYEALLMGWPGFTDPDMNIYNVLTCKAQLNYSGYCNNEVDRLLDAARASADLSERVKLYTRVREITAAEEPDIYLYHRKWIWAHTAKLKGFIAYPDGFTRIMDLTLE